MAKELDNKKMWESIMEHVPSGWMRDAIRNALKDQGLKYKDGKIVSIEQALRESQRIVSAEAKEALLPDGELTDFEKCFQGMCHEENQKFAKACCVSLMALARKQIVSELKEYIDGVPKTMVSKDYIDGLEDALEQLK